jgi:glycosyltransferase involved in cell wall biosynthesis
VLAQEDVKVEVVIVDDGSSDATTSLGTTADERVVYLRNDRASGVAQARNQGIRAARGEWVAFLDDDDFWAPTKLQSQLRACAAEAADFSYTGLVLVDENLGQRRVFPPTPAQGLERTLLETNAIGSPSSVIVRRSLLEQVEGFDPGFSTLADWDLYIRIAAIGRGAHCEAPMTAYLNHENNMHLDADSALEEFRRLRAKHRSFAESGEAPFGGASWWEWVASARRRSGHRFRAAALYLWVAIRFRKPDLAASAVRTLAGDTLSRPVRALWPAQPRESEAVSHDTEWIDAFAEA